MLFIKEVTLTVTTTGPLSWTGLTGSYLYLSKSSSLSQTEVVLGTWLLGWKSTVLLKKF